MMEETKTFLQHCLEGTMQPSEIQDAVDAYHAGDKEGTLREYLGFDPYEYEAWGREGDETVTEIVNAHRKGRTLREIRVAQVMLQGLFSLRGL